MENLSLKQMLLVSHSIGVELFEAVMSDKLKDKTLPVEFYRNYFNVAKGSADHDSIIQLVELGIMSVITDNYYRVTENGIKQFKKQFSELAIYMPKNKLDINYLKNKINFYCSFYNYKFGEDNSEHVISSYLNYYLKKYRMSHTTTDCVNRFKNELKRYNASGFLA